MALNLNPALIANATPYTGKLNALNLNTCTPPQEKQLRGVQIGVDFIGSPGKIIDMAAGGGVGNPLSQVSALWVDNTSNTHDVTIIIADTQQKIQVAFGAIKLAPVFSSLKSPRMYVMLNDNGANSSTDICNIIALNQYVPEFSSEDFVNSLSYGYRTGGNGTIELQPAFTQGTSLGFAYSTAFYNFADPLYAVLCTQFYMNGFECSIAGATNDGLVHQYYLFISDAATTDSLFNMPFVLTPQKSAVNLKSISGLQYVSRIGASSTGGIRMDFLTSYGDVATSITGVLAGTMFGGIITV